MMRKRWRLDIEARPTHLEHTYGCRLAQLRLQSGHLRLQPGSPTVAGRLCSLGGVAQVVGIVLWTVTRHHEARRKASACKLVG